jgi:polysaccharide biosynthesis protein PslH
MNILFLTEISPFPVKGGEKLRSYGLLKMLSNLGHNVTAVINTSSGIQQIDNVEFYEFNYKKYTKSYRYDFQFIRDLLIFFKNNDLIQLINSLLAKKKYDVAVIDYGFMGQYIHFFRKKGLKVIYGTHNAEAHLTFQRPMVTWRNKISHVITFIIQTAHERFFFKKANALMVVSRNDKKFYEKYITEKKIYYMPNMLNEIDYLAGDTEKENFIIMTGNFNAFQNSVGIEWFIQNVWCEELWSKTRLVLAGINSDIVLEQLKKKYVFKNIEALGIVDDIKALIKEAKASIVPLLDGGGTRLKCIEAMALRTQVISTSKGSEGIEHEGSIVIADEPVLFIKNIQDIIDDKINHTEKAHEIFMKEYSFSANQKRIQKIFENLYNLN